MLLTFGLIFHRLEMNSEDQRNILALGAKLGVSADRNSKTKGIKSVVWLFTNKIKYK
jgi:hypothetical protein